MDVSEQVGVRKANQARSGCPVRDDFDPLSDTFLVDPIALLRTIPPSEPVFYAPLLDYYVVTRGADIEAVFRDHETFSAAVAQQPLVDVEAAAQDLLLVDGKPARPSMVSLDGEEHARLRRPASRAFTAKRVAAMEPTIRQTVRRLLASVDARRFELVTSLAFPLPAITIFTMIGVPEADHTILKRWCGRRAELFWGRPHPDQQVAIARDIVANRTYLRALVAQRDTDRRDDLTSALLEIHDERPDRLTLDEIASILFSLMFAGHETTTALITNAVRRLLETPGEWQALVGDPSRATAAVEETLRYDTSVPIWRRVTTRPVRIGGVDLPAGAKVLLWIAAAGRDRTRYVDPDRFNPGAGNRSPATFGLGAHYCLGAALGRLEAKVALEELAARYPTLELEAQEFAFPPNLSFRGPEALWVSAGSSDAA